MNLIKETIAEMQQELDSTTIEEIIQAVATDNTLKWDIHKVLIDHFTERADKGEKFKVTRRQLGLMVVLEGLIIMSAAREAENHHTQN